MPAVDRDVPTRLGFSYNQELDSFAAAAWASESNAPIFPILPRQNQISTRKSCWQPIPVNDKDASGRSKSIPES